MLVLLNGYSLKHRYFLLNAAEKEEVHGKLKGDFCSNQQKQYQI